MSISRSNSHEQEYDVCVVGAGPVGLTLALECEAAGLSVLLIEAGQASPGKLADRLRRADISDPSNHVPLDVATRSGFGGTSMVWGGRCVPLDDIDFEKRSFVPNSGWPISNDDLKSWYAKAVSYLDCGSEGFVSSIPAWNETEDVSSQTIERLSLQPRVGRRFASKLTDSTLLRVRLGEIVEGIELEVGGESVNSLRLASSGFRPKARAFVLACGGLQSTRILLDLQRDNPLYFNGEEGPLGRFYMGHLTGKIASVVFHDPNSVDHFDYSLDRDHHWYRRRFCLAPNTQREKEILNIAFWLGNPPFHDPIHGSAASSSLFLNLKMPFARMKYFSSDFVSFHRGNGSLEFRKHMANILRDPKDAARILLKAATYRLSSDELRPFFVRNPNGIYSLHYHAEQIPHASNRVQLKRGSDGLPQLSINFRYCEQDLTSIVRAYEILDRALRDSGKGYVKYWQQPEESVDRVLAQAHDGYHQIGTIRMNPDSTRGVVDENCRVHGLKNLYVAGSAVFPTSGQANPTFAAVALAARLAHHLAKVRLA